MRRIGWRCAVSAGGASHACLTKRGTAFYIISAMKGKTKTKGRENYLRSWWTNEEACNSKQPNRVKFCFLGNGPIITQRAAIYPISDDLCQGKH